MRDVLPTHTVRGAIRRFIEVNAHHLGPDVLECGTFGSEAWWTNNRDLASARWTGVDIRPGPHVDLVANLEQLPGHLTGAFSGVLCSEVLEHVRRPLAVLRELLRVMMPHGFGIFTTLTAFPIHAYPDDFRRWTENGLRAELEDAGFVDIETANAGAVAFELDDHGAGVARMTCPIHVFATARKRG